MIQRLSAIDVCSTKVCTIVADADDGGIRILGAGVAPARGLNRGMVVNRYDALDSIQRSVAMAEESAGHKIDSAAVKVTGRSHYRDVISVIKEVLPGQEEPIPALRGSRLQDFLTELKRMPHTATKGQIESLGQRWNTRSREAVSGT